MTLGHGGDKICRTLTQIVQRAQILMSSGISHETRVEPGEPCHEAYRVPGIPLNINERARDSQRALIYNVGGGLHDLTAW